MAIIQVCDECGLEKRTPFQVTEENGDTYDICSGKCYSDHVQRMRNGSESKT